MEVDKTYKVTLGGVRPAQLPTCRHNFVFFDVTSCVNIDCIDHSCVRLASSVQQVLELKSKGIGFKYHVILTLCLEYILYMVIYDIYIYSKYISYNAPLCNFASSATVSSKVSQQCNKPCLK